MLFPMSVMFVVFIWIMSRWSMVCFLANVAVHRRPTINVIASKRWNAGFIILVKNVQLLLWNFWRSFLGFSLIFTKYRIAGMFPTTWSRQRILKLTKGYLLHTSALMIRTGLVTQCRFKSCNSYSGKAEMTSGPVADCINCASSGVCFNYKLQ